MQVFYCLVGLLLLQCWSTLASNSCTYTFDVPQNPGPQCGNEIHVEIGEIKGEINTLMSMVIDLQNGLECSNSNQSQSGPTFIRWGRTSCPQGASYVYKGYTSTSLRTVYGGSSEFVCLPSNPEYGRVAEGDQAGSKLYGTVYKHTGDLLLEDNANTTLVNQQVPCVMCLAEDKWVAETLESKTSCPDGWQKQYGGYLMTEHSSGYSRISPICVDEAPEVIAGGPETTYSSGLFFMEPNCPSMPCVQGQAGSVIPCATCTK